jgi:hypothetical protein
MRLTTRFPSTALAATVVLVGASNALASSPVKGSSGPLSASMVMGTSHAPKDNVKWPLSVTATLHGKPAHATAIYEFLEGGAVVSTQYPHSNKHFSFTGHYSDKIGPTGSLSVGQPLTMRVVISAGGYKVNRNWAITPVS